MKLLKVLSISFLMLIFTDVKTEAQSKKTAQDIGQIIFQYCSDNSISRKLNDPGQKNYSELIFVILNVDSVGKISEIRLMADTKIQDSAFAILDRLTLEHFSEWKSTENIFKTIIVPVISIAPSKNPSYISKAVNRNILNFKETDDVIVLRPLTFGWGVVKD